MLAKRVVCCSHQSDRRILVCISHKSDCHIRDSSCKLRCYTRTSSPERNRNNTPEKISYFFTCVWYRQSAADTSLAFGATRSGWWMNGKTFMILSTSQFVGTFSLVSYRVKHSNRNSIPTRAHVLFSMYLAPIISQLSCKWCHGSRWLCTKNDINHKFWANFGKCNGLWP